MKVTDSITEREYEIPDEATDWFFYVVITTNTIRRNVRVLLSETIRDILNDAGVDYTKGRTAIDGMPVIGDGFNKSLRDFGITTDCYLVNVEKIHLCNFFK